MKETRRYVPRVHYTPGELDAAAIADWENDAAHAERQAAEGPFFPANGITRESCLAYAAQCRAKVEHYRHSGAHKAMLTHG